MSPLGGYAHAAALLEASHDRYPVFAITCPFHGNATWRWIRDHDPDGWADAVAFDKAIRHGYARANANGQTLRGQYFLHRSCLPLDQANLDTRPAARGEPSQLNEDGDPTGCSPWSCRSGLPADAQQAA